MGDSIFRAAYGVLTIAVCAREENQGDTLSTYNFSHDELITHCRSALRGDKSACLLVAGYYSLNGWEMDAAQWAKILADKGDLDGLLVYGWNMMEAGFLKQAEEAFKAASKKDPEKGSAALTVLAERRDRGSAASKQSQK